MKKLITLLLFAFLFQTFYAQEISLKDVNSQNILQLLRNDTSKNFDGKSSKAIQIGDFNEINILDKSQKSEIVITQFGDFNNTLFVNPENDTSKASINISGSNNYIDITGSNSISNGMKINLKTNDKMIFVRNY